MRNIRAILMEQADEKYRKFQSALLPGVDNLIGVRVPELRKIAKAQSKAEPLKFIQQLGDSFEEVMLHGMAIGYLNAKEYSIFSLIEAYLPKITNWSLCDSFCSGLKFTKTHQEEMWGYILPLFVDEREYYVRFALVMSTFYFIDEEHIGEVLEQISKVLHPGYYAQMAQAWAISICYVHFPEETTAFLRSTQLEEFVFRKAIQKICESKQVRVEAKQQVRMLEQANSKE